MWPYWIMYLAPAAMALTAAPGGGRAQLNSRAVGPGFLLYALVMILLTGLRFQVGGDWFNYLGEFEAARSWSFGDVLAQQQEPGYAVLNWSSLKIGWDIYGVNLCCAAVFFVGLAVLCRASPRPWLAMAVATPYLVVVVAMGYSRQSVALGFAMLGYVALARDSKATFVMWVLLGAMFHRTAALLLPVAILTSTNHRLWSAVWLGVVCFLGYRLALEADFETLYSTYVGGEVQSQGAFIRLFMDAAPAALFLLFRTRFNLSGEEERLWLWISIISIALFVGFLVMPSASTALDRIALYFLPMQVAVLSRLPGCFEKNGRGGAFVVGSIVAYYATVLFVWLNYAVHAGAWTTYRFYPLEI